MCLGITVNITFSSWLWPLHSIMWLYLNLLCYVLLYSTLLDFTLLCYTLLYSTMLYSTLLYSDILYSTLLCYTLLYSTLLYSTLLCSTLFYASLLHYIPWPSVSLCYSRLLQTMQL